MERSEGACLLVPMIQACPEAVLLTTWPEGMYLEANAAYFDLTGYVESDMAGKRVSEFGLWPDTTTRDEYLLRLWNGGRVRDFEGPLRMRSGEIRIFLLSADIVDAGGRPCLLTFGRDITGRKRVEEALRQSEDKFQRVFHTSPDAISITRLRDGVCHDVNLGFLELTGWTREEIIGQSSLEMAIWITPSDRERLAEELLARGEMRNFEAEFRRKDGSIAIGLMSARLIEIDGESCILAVTRDLSDRIRIERERAALEERLREARRLEAIGKLAGGVAHDLNNLLMPILGNADLLLAGPASEAVRSERVRDIREAADRARALTRQLLAFSRRQMLRPRRIDLVAEIAETLPGLSRILPESIRLEGRMPEDPVPAMADPVQLRQVVMNLVLNARDAMPGGGTVVVSVGDAHVEPGQAGAFDVSPGRYARLLVEDQGGGIDPAHLTKIFEPFFTTRERGTGLGLSTVWGIVRQHGGAVSVDSAPGAGARFEVLLPQGAASAAELAQTSAETSRSPAPGTVLVVEDERLVRALIRQVLSGKGYRVLEASDAGSALAIAQAERPDIVLSDVALPGGDGAEVLRRISVLCPSARLLLMSGYPGTEAERFRIGGRLIPFLHKPFSPGTLLEALAAVE